MPTRLPAGSFYGHTSGRAEVGGFILSEARYTPGQTLPPHSHECAFFYFVLGGSSTEQLSHQSRSAGPGSLVFHPAGEPHANHWHQDGGHCLHIEIMPDTLARLHERAVRLEEPAEVTGGLPVWLCRRLYRELHQADVAASLAMEGLLLELVAEASRRPYRLPERRQPRWLSGAEAILQEGFNQNLTLAEIAGQLEIHPTHLARAFRQHHGCTVGEYIRRLRIEQARGMLASPDVALVDVAPSAGFADQSHFTRTFKRYVGLTPQQYRRSISAR